MRQSVNFVPKKFIQNATVAKIHTYFGKRLTEEDYKTLTAMKNIGEVADYLKKNTHYSPIFTDVEPASVHRGTVETLLRKYHFEKGIEWCNFQHVDKEPFYRFHYVLREINEILNSLMNLNAGVPDEYIRSLPSYLIKKSSFDLLQLPKIKDFNQLLGVLQDTPYYNLLSDVPFINGKINFNICENRLRSYYTSRILEIVTHDFKGSAQSKLFQIIKSQIDLINVINIYRMKTYFHMAEDEIRELLLPASGRISKAIENELINAPDTEAFMKTLSKTIYGTGLDEATDASSIYFERNLTQLRVDNARHALFASNSAAVSFYSALFLFEIELKNLITILECIRYKKTSAYIESLLITI